MANPRNLVVGHGRLGRDATFRQNSDGSTIVFLSLMVNRNYQTNGKFEADTMNFQKFIPASNKGQLEYYKKWARKGFEADIVGSVQSSVFEKDGEKVYSSVLAVDVADLSTNNGASQKKLAETSADADDDQPF